jgi:hypothetical protein
MPRKIDMANAHIVANIPTAFGEIIKKSFLLEVSRYFMPAILYAQAMNTP